MKKILATAILFIPFFVLAQRPALVPPVVRFQDSNGKPLAFGKLYSYQAGTTTPLSTYANSTTSAVNPNPVILDATGSASVFLGANVYKLVLQNSASVVQWTADNIAQGGFEATTVNSFTGAQGTTRSGAVVALTGDYTCSMVTGCGTLPPIFYQTVAVSGTSATQEPTLNFIAGVSGSISALTLTAGGSGYTGAPTVTLSGGGCTTEPAASSVVSEGAVTSLVIVSSGSGCASAPTVAFSGGGGTGAMATSTLVSGGITCVDNPTAMRTDCTFIAGNGGGGGATTSAKTYYWVNNTVVTEGRALNNVYTNTLAQRLDVSVTLYNVGAGNCSMQLLTAPTGTTLQFDSEQQYTFTVVGGPFGREMFIPPGYDYKVTTNCSANIQDWNETTVGIDGSGGSSIALTTTGSEGPATLVDGVLNIPVYTGGSSGGVQLSPSATQVVTQPSTTTLSVNNLNYVPYAITGVTTAVAPPLLAAGLSSGSTGGTVAANTYACYTTNVGGNGGETTVSPVSGSVTTTGTTSLLSCGQNSNSAGEAKFNVYVSTNGGTAYLTASNVPYGTNAVITTTPPTSGTVAPTANTAISTVSYAQNALSGGAGMYVKPSNFASSAGAIGEPLPNQLGIDQSAASISQNCGTPYGSPHSGLANTSTNTCDYIVMNLPSSLASSQVVQGLGVNLYQGGTAADVFGNNSAAVGSASVAGFFGNYRLGSSTAGNWALNTYNYYTNQNGPTYGLEAIINNASGSDDPESGNQAYDLHLLSQGSNKPFAAVGIGGSGGWENGVYIVGVTGNGVYIAPGAGAGILNQSPMYQESTLNMTTSSASAVAAAPPIYFGSYVDNSSSVITYDAFSISPQYGAGSPPSYGVLNFAHVAGPTTNWLYGFDAKIQAPYINISQSTTGNSQSFFTNTGTGAQTLDVNTVGGTFASTYYATVNGHWNVGIWGSSTADLALVNTGGNVVAQFANAAPGGSFLLDNTGKTNLTALNVSGTSTLAGFNSNGTGAFPATGTATNTNNYASNGLTFGTSTWNGTAAAAGSFSIAPAVAAGTNAFNVLNFGYTAGSTGPTYYAFNNGNMTITGSTTSVGTLRITPAADDTNLSTEWTNHANTAVVASISDEGAAVFPSLQLNGGTVLTSQSSANPQIVTCPTGGTGTQYCGADGAWHTASGGACSNCITSATSGTEGQVPEYTGSGLATVPLSLGSMAQQNSSSVSITGGTLDGVTVGGTTPAAGTFTTATAGNAAMGTSVFSNYAGFCYKSLLGNFGCGFVQDSSGNTYLSGPAGGSGTINIGFGFAGATPALQFTNDGSNNSAGVFSKGVGSPVYSAKTLYSAAGTALPTCNAGSQGDQRVVSDALTPLYMTAYTSGGAVTAAVICSYNGTTYAWLTH